MNWLKLHLFLLYSALSGCIGFLTVFYKTYTDATYDEIGLLLTLSTLGSALLKPLVCASIDRSLTYKRSLVLSVLAFGLCLACLALVPFYPQLLFDEPHPRLVWWLVALVSSASACAVGLATTLSDVFAVQRCGASTTGEHYGQYRLVGSLGWLTCALALAALEGLAPPLPQLALPLLVALGLALADALLVASRLPDVERRAASTECLVVGAKLKPADAQVFATVRPARLQQTRASASSLAEECDRVSGADAGRRQCRVALCTQLELLRRLNRLDHFNMAKYLVALVALGALQQVHCAFHLQLVSEALAGRGAGPALLAVNGALQLGACLGESLSLVWLARVSVRLLGRDLSLLLCALLSAARYAAYAHLLDRLDVWALAALELLSGLLLGTLATLATEAAACYLWALDRLLLTEDEERGQERAAQLAGYLERLRERHSLEAIRFALRATIQSVFGGALVGVGFALGPLLAGLWLRHGAESLRRLYQDLGRLQLWALVGGAAGEWLLVRLLLGARSLVDRLELTGAGKRAGRV